MTLLLALIALPGIAAILLRWSAAVFKAARYSAERFVASQIADQRAQRGDISGMTEAENIRRRSRNEQLAGVGRVLFWTAAIAVPIFLPGTFVIYALFGFLWFLPKSTSRSEST
ncbi:MAG TPA: hypothetical protein VM100_03505 [Longimicrobiales bacterium]|nr:hypothetical protein [Longimicrobiales bacterium]